MAQTNSEIREAPGAQAHPGQVNPPLDLPTSPPVEIWDELADEAQTYLTLLAKLKATAKEAPEREALEQQLLGSLAHLQMHSQVLEQSVTDALELADELEALPPSDSTAA